MGGGAGGACAVGYPEVLVFINLVCGVGLKVGVVVCALGGEAVQLVGVG